MRPFVRSMLYAARLAATVETSASGEFEPSLVRKIGSLPRVASNRSCRPAGVTVMLFSGWWHVTQRRPFTPRSRKKGLSVATTGKPAPLIVWATPDSFLTLKLAPCGPPGTCLRTEGAVSVLQTTDRTRPIPTHQL